MAIEEGFFKIPIGLENKSLNWGCNSFHEQCSPFVPQKVRIAVTLNNYFLF
jgi:hypothetical protein